MDRTFMFPFVGWSHAHIQQFSVSLFRSFSCLTYVCFCNTFLSRFSNRSVNNEHVANFWMFRSSQNLIWSEFKFYGTGTWYLELHIIDENNFYTMKILTLFSSKSINFSVKPIEKSCFQKRSNIAFFKKAVFSHLLTVNL